MSPRSAVDRLVRRIADSVPTPPLTVRFGSDVAPVRNTPPALARRFYQICVTMVADSLADAQLTPLQIAAMAYLNRKNGEPGIDQNALAARLGVDRSHVTLLVEELAERRLIERRLNAADRRVRLLHLTSKGEKLFAQVLPANVAASNRILEPLRPDERKLFVDMLLRVIAANGAYARPGAGRRNARSKVRGPKE